MRITNHILQNWKILLIYFFLFNSVYSQVNLIPNGSFEDIISCPTDERRNIAMARPWFSAYDWPNLYCSCNAANRIPLKSYYRYVVSPSGQNYAGYNAYYYNRGGVSDYTRPSSEVLGVKLCDSLKVGVRYYASFKIVMVASNSPIKGFSHHGIKFSTRRLTPVPSEGASITNRIISNFAHVYSNQPVRDSLHWTTIKGSFIADSNYKYAYVGILFQTSIADAGQTEAGEARWAHYYIDDICLSTDSGCYKKTPPALCTPTSDRISLRQIHENDFCRNTFYSWTTEEQINQLRGSKVLLTKSKSDAGEYSYFEAALRDSTFRNDGLVQMLLEERFAKKRYAWPNSFATVMGWKKEKYGHHLLKIVLHDSAIIGKFKKYYFGEALSFYDLKGKKLNNEYVMKHKNWIAAIYHLNFYKGSRQQFKRIRTGRNRTRFSYTNKHSRQQDNIEFREFVIINEEMISDWSYGTQEIKEEIGYEIELLKNLQKSTSAKQYAYRGSGGYDWKFAFEGYIPANFKSIKEADEEYRYQVSIAPSVYHFLLCFRNDYYLFNPEALQKIINTLEAALNEQLPEIKK